MFQVNKFTLAGLKTHSACILYPKKTYVDKWHAVRWH